MRTVIKCTFLIASIFTASLMVAQCSQDPTGGTSCVSPLRTKAAPGQSPTFSVDFTPATTAFPCIKAPTGVYRLCGQAGQITVDFNDGAGFVSLKGKDGKDGAAGLPGIDGVSGTNGVDGKNGVDGINGKDGTNGTNGLNGVDGKDGAQGPQGVQGIQGVKGDTGPQGPPGTYPKSFTLICSAGVGTVPKGFKSKCSVTVP